MCQYIQQPTVKILEPRLKGKKIATGGDEYEISTEPEAGNTQIRLKTARGNTRRFRDIDALEELVTAGRATWL